MRSRARTAPTSASTPRSGVRTRQLPPRSRRVSKPAPYTSTSMRRSPRTSLLEESSAPGSAWSSARKGSRPAPRSRSSTRQPEVQPATGAEREHAHDVEAIVTKLPRVTYTNMAEDFSGVHAHLDALIPEVESRHLGRRHTAWVGGRERTEGTVSK